MTMAGFASPNTIAEVANLIGDVARASILSALMGGQALTAGELADEAGVTPQTASSHLAKLMDAGLIDMEKQGRHRYYRLASADVAHAIDALMGLAASGPKRHRPVGPRDEALRLARTCYDHMAGRLAIAIGDSLAERGLVVVSGEAGLVTESGQSFLQEFGIDLDADAPSRRPVCRTCLDWSERRPHLAGRLGAALLDRMLATKWVARTPASRALSITRAGEAGLAAKFGLPSDWRTPKA